MLLSCVVSVHPRRPHVSAGAVASLVAVLLQDGGAPPGMGPVSCIGIGPASAMNLALAKRCDHFVTSVCLRYGASPVAAKFALLNTLRRRALLLFRDFRSLATEENFRQGLTSSCELSDCGVRVDGAIRV